jgi:hypothetical protein
MIKNGSVWQILNKMDSGQKKIDESVNYNVSEIITLNNCRI